MKDPPLDKKNLFGKQIKTPIDRASGFKFNFTMDDSEAVAKTTLFSFDDADIKPFVVTMSPDESDVIPSLSRCNKDDVDDTSLSVSTRGKELHKGVLTPKGGQKRRRTSPKNKTVPVRRNPKRKTTIKSCLKPSDKSVTTTYFLRSKTVGCVTDDVTCMTNTALSKFWVSPQNRKRKNSVLRPKKTFHPPNAIKLFWA